MIERTGRSDGVEYKKIETEWVGKMNDFISQNKPLNQLEIMAKEYVTQIFRPPITVNMQERLEELWLVSSFGLQGEQDQYFKSLEDWHAWKRATIAWHKPMYEAGVVVTEIAINDDVENMEKAELHLKNWTGLKPTGLYDKFSYEELSEEQRTSGILALSKNHFFTIMERREQAGKVGDDEVFARAMYAEPLDGGCLPWQAFANNSFKKGMMKMMPAALFWGGEALNMPIRKHHRGGMRAPWFDLRIVSDYSECRNRRGEVEDQGYSMIDYLLAWAERHKDEFWPSVIKKEIFSCIDNCIHDSGGEKNHGKVIRLLNYENIRENTEEHNMGWSDRWRNDNLPVWSAWAVQNKSYMEALTVDEFFSIIANQKTGHGFDVDSNDAIEKKKVFFEKAWGLVKHQPFEFTEADGSLKRLKGFCDEDFLDVMLDSMNGSELDAKWLNSILKIQEEQVSHYEFAELKRWTRTNKEKIDSLVLKQKYPTEKPRGKVL